MEKNTGDGEKTARVKKRRKKVVEDPSGKDVAGMRIEEAPSASKAVDSVGSFLPGLMELIGGLKQTGPFQERLKEIDEELKRRSKEGDAQRKGPHLDYSFSVRTLHDGAVTGRPPSTYGKQPPRKAQRPQVRMERHDLEGKDRLVEVVEMTEEILVLVELRGLDEHDVHLDLLNEESLSFVAKREGAVLFRKEIPLPRPVEKEMTSDSRNGVLIIRLVKTGR